MVKLDEMQGTVKVNGAPANQNQSLNTADVVEVSPGASCRLGTYDPTPAYVGMTAFICNSGGVVNVTPGAGAQSLSSRYWYGGSYRYNLAPKQQPPASIGIRA